MSGIGVDYPIVTSDGLTTFFSEGPCGGVMHIVSATRATTHDPFGSPAPLPELDSAATRRGTDLFIASGKGIDLPPSLNQSKVNFDRRFLELDWAEIANGRMRPNMTVVVIDEPSLIEARYDAILDEESSVTVDDGGRVWTGRIFSRFGRARKSTRMTS